jgi:hypothetical protein
VRWGAVTVIGADFALCTLPGVERCTNVEREQLARVVLDHFEKVLALGAVMAACVAGVGISQPVAGESDRRDLLQASARVSAHMKTAGPSPEATQDQVASLRLRLDPESVVAAVTLPQWLAHRRPTVLTRTPPPPIVPLVKHDAALLSAPQAGRGSIRLTWTPPRTVGLNVRIEGLELWRQTNQATWELLTRLKPGATDFLDETVVAGFAYRYRLRSEAARGRGLGLEEFPSKHRYRQSKSSVALQSLPTILIGVNTVTIHNPVTQPEGADSAYLFVYRWDAAKGHFVRRGFLVQVGASIGDPEAPTGARLSKVRLETQPHPTLGHDQQVQVATIHWASGRGEEVTDRDAPPRVK